MRCLVLATAYVLAIATPAFSSEAATAQSHAGPVPDMAAQRLQALAGSWKVLGTLKAQGQSHKVTGTLTAESIADGFSVRDHLRVTIEGMGPYQLHRLWGYDQGTQRVHQFATSSIGETYDNQGRWRDAKTLVLAVKGKAADGTTYQAEEQIQFTSPSKIHFMTTVRVDGKVASVLEATAHRSP